MRTKEGKLNRYLVLRIIVAAYRVFIAICVTCVMLNIYNPEQNIIKALASVSMDHEKRR